MRYIWSILLLDDGYTVAEDGKTTTYADYKIKNVLVWIDCIQNQIVGIQLQKTEKQ